MQIHINEGLKHLKVLSMSDLTPVQDNLKTLSPANYERLKSAILQKGFCFPMFVWPFEGKNYTSLMGTNAKLFLKKKAGIRPFLAFLLKPIRSKTPKKSFSFVLLNMAQSPWMDSEILWMVWIGIGWIASLILTHSLF